LSVCGVSLCTMTATSLDRFLALHYHMRFPNFKTEERAAYTSGILWVMNILLSMLWLLEGKHLLSRHGC